MLLGLSLETFTLVHVLISLVGIGAGFGVLFGLLHSMASGGWTMLFLASTVLTSVTGFMFPFAGFLPSHGVAAISVVLLVIALFALYGRHLGGPWRWVYVVTAVLALYLNVFVLVVQLFLRVPALNTLAPKGAEPPFAITQGIVLLVFIALTIAGAIKFRPAASA
ncbi:MAG TPA: hypothetical protein VD863_14715 [Bradyrhizobium sp.]|nr:hypothetical protein [Bradyrhizobium sp.]